jgi:hypothetical protein
LNERINFLSIGSSDGLTRKLSHFGQMDFAVNKSLPKVHPTVISPHAFYVLHNFAAFNWDPTFEKRSVQQ